MTNAADTLAELVDYETGALGDEEADAFEERLFAQAAAGTASEAEFVDRCSRIGRYLLPRGGWDIGSSKARVDSLVAAGLKVQIIDPEPAANMRIPPIEDQAEIVVTVFRLDARGYDSLDVHCTKPDGTELKTFRDVSCDPETGFLYAVCEAPLARISYRQRRIVTEVIGTRGGQPRTLAKFETLSEA